MPAGAALLDIGDPSRMEVLSELLTTDAVQAQPGRRVVIERWGGPPVEGRVRRVEPAAFTKVSALGIEEQRVNVLIDITSPPQAWRAMGDGFRVTARIITRQRRPRARWCPSARSSRIGQDMAVYKLDGRRARAAAGARWPARNGSEAWVRDGLAPGDKVVVYPPAGARRGQAGARFARREAVPRHQAFGSSSRTSSTGTGLMRATPSAALPSVRRVKPRRPCVPMTIRSHACWRGLLDDHVGHALARHFAQQRLAMHRSGFGLALGLGQHVQAVLAQAPEHVFVAGGRRHLDQRGVVVHDVQEKQAGVLAGGQFHRFAQAALGGGAAIDGDEDSLVHDTS